MAKQLGIHQIKGKVGQRSYYRTKGVVDGISRSINQGMSARVKNGDEYANTRLNNAEFKNANAIASAAFNSVNTRNRSMMRTFAVAEMTKRALEDIKQGSGAWGARHPYTELDRLICEMLEHYAKTGAYNGEYGTLDVTTPDREGEAEVGLTLSASLQTELMAAGIDAIQIIYSACKAGEIDVDGAPRLFAGAGISPSAPITLTGSSEITTSKVFNLLLPATVGMSQSGYTFADEDTNHGYFVVATILPLRRVGSKQYVLQELCTFVAVPLGKIPD